MGLLDSLGKLAEDVYTIAAAPVEVATDTIRAVTKPTADAAKEIADTVKSEILGNGDE